MKTKWMAPAIVVLGLAVSAPEAKAQPFGTVAWAGAPQPGNGSITASGTYTAANGWAPVEAKLNTLPMAGGVLQWTTAANAPAMGNWGPITVTNLAVGQYAVFCVIKLTNANQVDFVTSPVNIVNVIAVGGQPPVAPGTVSYGTGDPTAGKGTIQTGPNGTYTITAQGYNPTGCALLPIPMLGGEFPNPTAGMQVPANGKWGPVTVNNLAAGQYLVVGYIPVFNGMMTQISYSPGAIVNVQ
jgi:hypothetical protein